MGRIRTFPFLRIPSTTTPSLMIQMIQRKRVANVGSMSRGTNQSQGAGIENFDWFVLQLLFPTYGRGISLPNNNNREKNYSTSYVLNLTDTSEISNLDNVVDDFKKKSSCIKVDRFKFKGYKLQLPSASRKANRLIV